MFVSVLDESAPSKLEDGGSTFLQNVHTNLPDFVVSCITRQPL